MRPAAFVNAPGRLPAAARGAWHNATIHIVDWLPTFARLAGVDAAALPADLDGVDQWPVTCAGFTCLSGGRCRSYKNAPSPARPALSRTAAAAAAATPTAAGTRGGGGARDAIPTLLGVGVLVLDQYKLFATPPAGFGDGAGKMVGGQVR